MLKTVILEGQNYRGKEINNYINPKMSILTTISNYIIKIWFSVGEWSFRFKNRKKGGDNGRGGEYPMWIILEDIKTVDWVLTILHKHNSRCCYCNRRTRPKTFGVLTKDKICCNRIGCLIKFNDEKSII